MRRLILCMGLAAMAVLQACTGDSVDPDTQLPESAYRPLLMPRTQLEQSVVVKPPRTLSDPGKLYSIGNYVLVNERYKGIHVIDNQNPSAPQNLGFVQVPGCIDIAAKGNIIYADNAVDLIAIDFTAPLNPVVTKRVPSVFPALVPPDELPLAAEFAADKLPQDAVIVGWVKR